MGVSDDMLYLETKVLIELYEGEITRVNKTNKYFGFTLIKYIMKDSP